MYIQNTSLQVHSEFQSFTFNGLASLGTESFEKSSEILCFEDPGSYLISTKPPFSSFNNSRTKKDINTKIAPKRGLGTKYDKSIKFFKVSSNKSTTRAGVNFSLVVCKKEKPRFFPENVF